MFDIPKSKKKKPKDTTIPDKMFLTEGIPDTILLYYKNKIDFERINKVIKQKLILKNEPNKYKIFFSKVEKYMNNNNIDDYLDHAKEHIDIKVIKKKEDKLLCINCGEDIEIYKENNNVETICPFCLCINITLFPKIYTRDIDKQSKKSEEDINNFEKILDKFEGKNVNQIDDYIIQKLDDYFDSIGFKNSKEIYNMKNLEDGKKPFTNKKMLWNALDSINYKFYEDINYIANLYWGWELPDLTNYRQRILLDYRKTQKIWNEIKHEYNRSASLGTQYRLFVHLKAVNFPHCNLEDFRIQESIESLRLHNSAWKIMCERSGIKYYEVDL